MQPSAGSWGSALGNFSSKGDYSNREHQQIRCNQYAVNVQYFADIYARADLDIFSQGGWKFFATNAAHLALLRNCRLSDILEIHFYKFKLFRT